jgi:signal transduction histidine kinase
MFSIKEWLSGRIQSSAVRSAFYSGCWALLVAAIAAFLAAREVADYELKLFDQDLEHQLEVYIAGLRRLEGRWFQQSEIRMPKLDHPVTSYYAVFEGSKLVFGNQAPPAIVATKLISESVFVDGIPYRVWTGRAVASGNEYDAKIWADLRPINEGVTRAAWVLALAALIAGLLAAAGVGILTRRQLRPFDDIQRQIRRNRNSLKIQSLEVPANAPEAARLARAYNEVLVKLSDSAQDLDRFAARCAHELRTPLTVLRLSLENNLTSGVHTDDAQFVEQQLETVDRLTLLVNRLLSLARGAGLGDMMSVELRNPVAAALHEIQPLLEEHGWQVEVDIAPALLVMSNAGALQQVLLDLLDNCIRHNADAGLVSLTARQSNGKTQLSIVNSRSVAQARANYKGFGLGKPIIQRLVREMGGVVTWANDDHGTSVQLTLLSAEPNKTNH